MVNRKSFAVGVLLSITLMSCASFAFKYYGLAGIRYEDGTLLGPKPENDLPFSSCAPTSQVKNPCVVMFAAEFFKMKTDYEDTKQRLKDLEATCKP